MDYRIIIAEIIANIVMTAIILFISIVIYNMFMYMPVITVIILFILSYLYSKYNR